MTAHELSVVWHDTFTGVCQDCGHVRVKLVDGNYMCGVLASKRHKRSREYRTAVVKDRCSRCGFVPEHPCQLDIHHVVDKAQGGSHKADNLQILCASCHRLATLQPALFARPYQSLTRVSAG